jgi:hypothetical protein
MPEMVVLTPDSSYIDDYSLINTVSLIAVNLAGGSQGGASCVGGVG